MVQVALSPTWRAPSRTFWAGSRVLLTGHTGFKGSWLARWLAGLGAEVHGLALNPISDPSLFDVADVLGTLASDSRVDLREMDATARVVRGVSPDIVLHLAAQPLVREGYRDPAGTFAINVTGTSHLLAALRESDAAQAPRAIVVVTSDKVYRPMPAADGGARPFVEDDALGGHDPYASSKAMVEDLVDVYRSLPAIDGHPVWTTPIATARAGNVIGGGDWSADRLVPDCIRAFSAGDPVVLRYPDAVRPWQHVLDPIAGYLLLAEDLATGSPHPPSAVNFGPVDREGSELTVRDVARTVARLWGAEDQLVTEGSAGAAPETGELRIDSSLAVAALGWRPRWSAGEALERTVDWYRAHREGRDMPGFTDEQIADYVDE